MPEQVPYIVKPVSRALRLLRVLGETGEEQTLSEVCRTTGLPKSTAFKYLRTLLDAGYVDHDPSTDCYRVGLVVWELAQSVAGRLRVRDAALPFMRTLSARLGETVNLAVLDGRQIVYLEVVGWPSATEARGRFGSRGSVYSTALGKAMLASLPEEEWRRQVPACLTPRTVRTIASFGALERDLALARQRGFALDCGENVDGMWCAAAAINQPARAVAGAISVSASASQLTAHRQQQITAAVCELAGAISRRLAGRSAGAGSPRHIVEAGPHRVEGNGLRPSATRVRSLS